MVCRGRLVSRKACSAHGRACRGRLVSRKACSAHGRACRGHLVSRKACSAHGRVCRGRLVSRKACSAHGPHKGLVVSKKADLAHEVFTRSWQKQLSVHRSGSSAHEGPHKGLVVSKKADLAHEVFTRSKVVRKKEANHAQRSRVCRRRFNVLGQDWSSALRISAARAGETSLERSSRGAAAMRATEP